MKSPLFVLSAASCLLLATSCASIAPVSHQPEPPTDAQLEALPIFDGHSAAAASFDDLLAAIDGADLVVLGELHQHPVGLPFDAKLFTASLQRHPNAALCLEFLTRDAQHILDAYTQGLIDWDALTEAMDGIPGSTPEPHRPLIEAAMASGVPVIAANAPRLYTRAAKLKGFDALRALSDEQQRLFDIPSELPAGPYRDGFYRMMSGGHTEAAADQTDTGGEPFEPSQSVKDKFRAQALWDGTMSASVARAYEAGHSPVFLVIGSYHCNNDGGTVQVL